MGRLYTRTLLARLILTFPNATVTVVSHGLPLNEFEHASLRSIFTAVDHDFVFLASARRLLTSIRSFSRLVGDPVGRAGGRVVSMGGAFGCTVPTATAWHGQTDPPAGHARVAAGDGQTVGGRATHTSTTAPARAPGAATGLAPSWERAAALGDKAYH